MTKTSPPDRRSPYEKWRDRDEELLLACLRERPGREGVLLYEKRRGNYLGPGRDELTAASSPKIEKDDWQNQY